MAAKKKNHYYAYTVDGRQGIVTTWRECEAIVRGRSARYRGFPTRNEAETWLRNGASYQDKRIDKAKARRALPEEAVYFDAGTGGGFGTEINVTDREGVPLLFLTVDESELTPRGTSLLENRTNNYGELLACRHAMEAALKLEKSTVCGDSALVLDYWSKGHVTAKKRESDPDLYRLARETAVFRREFEGRGGTLMKIGGGVNPADLGYHRD